jgi:hypothetical protein
MPVPSLRMFVRINLFQGRTGGFHGGDYEEWDVSPYGFIINWCSGPTCRLHLSSGRKK